jgi:transcriptional regulator with XRE-family HTH domain
VRQRQLGARLRSIRNDRGLNVEDVAAELLCSPSKISRLETAARGPNLRDIRDLCRVYRVDEATANELMDLARKAKEPGWWSQYADMRFDPYIGLEQDASAITAFTAFYIPDLLQTEEYSAAIFKGIKPKMNTAVLRDQIEIRLRRQQVLQGDMAPRYRVLVDEAVLHRPTGGPDVMVVQLDKVLNLVSEQRVTMQIVPFDAGVSAAQDSNFSLLEFADHDLPSVVFIEGLVGNQILERSADVDRYRDAFEHLRDLALTPRESVERMKEMRKHYTELY